MRVIVSAVFPNGEMAAEVRKSLLLRDVLHHHIFVEALWPSAAAVLGSYLGLPLEAAEPYEAAARSGGVLLGIRVPESLREAIEKLLQERGGTLVSQGRAAGCSLARG